MDNIKLKLLVQFIYETLFKNFELFKYVLTIERDVDVTDEQKIVHCPKEDINETLLNPKHYHIWEYDQKIKNINRQQYDTEVENMNDRIKLKNEEDELIKKIEQISFESDNINSKIDEKLITDLINIYTLPVLNSTKKLMSNEIIDIKEYFKFNIEKRLVQRPNELGKYFDFFYDVILDVSQLLSN